MRILPALAGAALLAAPAAAQKLGARTASPSQVLGNAAALDPQAEADQIAAAAAAHPLGTLENPVRVGGPEGERAYLGRLRCADGKPPQAFDRKSGSVGAFGSVVGLYTLDCGTAAPGRSQIAMDMYHEEHREAQAPAGFTITR